MRASFNATASRLHLVNVMARLDRAIRSRSILDQGTSGIALG